jgi:CheY-like chemotaxis protein
MMKTLGPRSRPAYEVLRRRILAGELAPGTMLASQARLAAEFGVAPMTMRQVLARLETEGLLTCETGRGTFVRARSPTAVLIVEAEAPARELVCRYVAGAGYRTVEAGGAAEGRAALECDPAIRLVLSTVRMPDAAASIAFIRTVRQRWPDVPLAVMIDSTHDLALLHGVPEAPILTIPKPVRAAQIEEVVALTLRGAALPPDTALAPVLVAHDDSLSREYLCSLVADAGHEVTGVASGQEAWTALARRRYGHVFLDLGMPGGGVEMARELASRYPNTTVILATACPAQLLAAAAGLVTVLAKPFNEAAVRDALRLRIAPWGA